METPLEQVLISMYKPDMIAYMKAHPEAFHVALNLALSDKQPFAWRAAWLLWDCMNEDDSRVKKHVKKIISYLPAARDNQKRELLKILSMMEIADDDCAQLFDYCTALWLQDEKAPSIRLACIKMALKISAKFPELTHEVIALTGDQYLTGLSPAVVKSLRKLISTVNTDH